MITWFSFHTFTERKLTKALDSFWRYLTRELIWYESIFHKALKDGIFKIIFFKEPVFPFWYSVLNKGTTWYHFYIVFRMTRHCLGIEPGTFRTQNQHFITSLSRRRSHYRHTCWTFSMETIWSNLLKTCLTIGEYSINLYWKECLMYSYRPLFPFCSPVESSFLFF